MFCACSCLAPQKFDGGSSEADASVPAAGNSDASVVEDAGSIDAGRDPHACDRVIRSDAGLLCVSTRDVTDEFYAVYSTARYLGVLSARGDRAFVVNFGTTEQDGGTGEQRRAGVWTSDWHVTYFQRDPRSAALNESDELGNLCDCALMGSPGTGYACAPRVWLVDGGSFEASERGPCVSMDDDLWMANSGLTWLNVRSNQFRLVPFDGGLGWDRVHVAAGYAVLSGPAPTGYRTIVMAKDAGIVRELPVSHPPEAAEATRVSRSGVVAGYAHQSAAQRRPVVWPSMLDGNPVDVVVPSAFDPNGFSIVGLSNDAAFCSDQNMHAIFHLEPGAAPLLDESLGLVNVSCGAAMNGGRFLLFANRSGGGRQPLILLRVTRCEGDCRQ